jgi:hypothetical protein
LELRAESDAGEVVSDAGELAERAQPGAAVSTASATPPVPRWLRVGWVLALLVAVVVRLWNGATGPLLRGYDDLGHVGYVLFLDLYGAVLAGVALTVASPYYARNVSEFDTPFKMSRDNPHVAKVEALQPPGARSWRDFVSRRSASPRMPACSTPSGYPAASTTGRRSARQPGTRSGRSSARLLREARRRSTSP